MRKVTLVIAGGDLGAAIAKALGIAEGVASVGYVHRQDGMVQVYGLASTSDSGARERWAKRCRREGLTVARAPWERGGK